MNRFYVAFWLEREIMVQHFRLAHVFGTPWGGFSKLISLIKVPPSVVLMDTDVF